MGLATSMALKTQKIILVVAWLHGKRRGAKNVRGRMENGRDELIDQGARGWPGCADGGR
jgi:hypothetical protein